MSSSFGYGQAFPSDAATEFAARQFQIDQTLANVRTMVLVKVIAVSGGAGAIAAPGTVNVQPLVNMVDGSGNSQNHGTIFNIPVFRLGGGGNVVICDPIVGDIGWMAVADRDSSAVVKNKKVSNPGSNRRFDMADGVYMGSILSGVPTQYITFTSTGIKIADKNSNVIEMKSGEVDITSTLIKVTGALQVNGALQLSGSIQGVSGGTYGGNIATSGSIIAGVGGADQVGLQTHKHTGNNIAPTPGT